MTIRLVATMAVEPTVVAEAVARARAMVAEAPGVRSAEVGVRRDPTTGEVVPGGYVVSTTFADHAALLRYAASAPHRELGRWVRPHVVDQHVAVYDADPAPG